MDWLVDGLPKPITFVRFLSSGCYPNEVSTALCIFFSAENGGFWLKLSHIYCILDFLHCVSTLLNEIWSLSESFHIFTLLSQCLSTVEVYWGGYGHKDYFLYSLSSQYFLTQRILRCPTRTKFILSGWKTIPISRVFIPEEVLAIDWKLVSSPNSCIESLTCWYFAGRGLWEVNRSGGQSLMNGISVIFQKKKKKKAPKSSLPLPPREDKARRQPSRNQHVEPHKTLNLPAPWPCTSQFHSAEK